MLLLSGNYYLQEEVLLFLKSFKNRSELKALLELASFDNLGVKLVDQRLLSPTLKKIISQGHTFVDLTNCVNVADFIASTSITPPSSYQFYRYLDIVNRIGKENTRNINSDELIIRLSSDIIEVIQQGKTLFFLGSREISSSRKYSKEEKEDFDSFVVLENEEIGRKFYFGVW